MNKISKFLIPMFGVFLFLPFFIKAEDTPSQPPRVEDTAPEDGLPEGMTPEKLQALIQLYQGHNNGTAPIGPGGPRPDTVATPPRVVNPPEQPQESPATAAGTKAFSPESCPATRPNDSTKLLAQELARTLMCPPASVTKEGTPDQTTLEWYMKRSFDRWKLRFQNERSQSKDDYAGNACHFYGLFRNNLIEIWGDPSLNGPSQIEAAIEPFQRVFKWIEERAMLKFDAKYAADKAQIKADVFSSAQNQDPCDENDVVSTKDGVTHPCTIDRSRISGGKTELWSRFWSDGSEVDVPPSASTVADMTKNGEAKPLEKIKSFNLLYPAIFTKWMTRPNKEGCSKLPAEEYIAPFKEDDSKTFIANPRILEQKVETPALATAPTTTPTPDATKPPTVPDGTPTHDPNDSDDYGD